MAGPKPLTHKQEKFCEGIVELLSNLVYGQPSSGDSVWLLNFLSVHKWSSVDHFCEIGKPT